MRIGFTGTRQGLAPAQRASLIRVVNALKPTQAHHGAARGADREFHIIVDGKCPIHLWPSDLENQASWSPQVVHSELRYHKAQPPLQRNGSIIVHSDVVIACPAQDTEQLRSGTWSTIRRARKLGYQLYIIYPNGKISRERYSRCQTSEKGNSKSGARSTSA